MSQFSVSSSGRAASQSVHIEGARGRSDGVDHRVSFSLACLNHESLVINFVFLIGSVAGVKDLYRVGKGSGDRYRPIYYRQALYCLGSVCYFLLKQAESL